MIAGRRVAITGGAGSIGGTLARRIAQLSPAHLTLIDNSECNIAAISRDLAAANACRHTLTFADVREGATIARTFARAKPDLVFHAAAMKHVPIVEANPCEGVLTNVFGARNVIDAAGTAGADLVFVSTDKAANPASVMGATKRLIELYCRALDRKVASSRRISVRLGNVLGSAGSVAPLFAQQLAAGGPLTVTHPEASRFFLTIEQAGDCLLQAAALGLGEGETRGATLVQDMGPPLAIADLARDMIRLHGLRPDIDVALNFIGLRPGEKLHEALIDDGERVEATSSARVSAIFGAQHALDDLSRKIDRLIAAACAGEDEMVRRLVHDIEPPVRIAV